MKIEKNLLLDKIQKILVLLKTYTVFIFIMLLLFVFGFFVFRINQYSNIEPDESALDDKIQTVSIPKIDEDVVTKIKDLQSQNVEVQTLFDQARNNPFNE